MYSPEPSNNLHEYTNQLAIKQNIIYFINNLKSETLIMIIGNIFVIGSINIFVFTENFQWYTKKLTWFYFIQFSFKLIYSQIIKRARHFFLNKRLRVMLKYFIMIIENMFKYKGKYPKMITNAVYLAIYFFYLVFSSQVLQN